MRQRLLLLAALITLSACAERAEQLTPNLTAAHPAMVELSKAGVMLTIPKEIGDPRAVADNPDCRTLRCTFSGRGVLVDDGLVLTAAHVVTAVDPGDWVRVDIGNYHGYA